MPRECVADDIVEVVVDKYSNAILTATSAEPIAVKEITEDVGISTATAYRRIGQLVDLDLLEERTWIDETGTQTHVYEANFESIKIEIVNGISYLHIVSEANHDLTRIWDYR